MTLAIVIATVCCYHGIGFERDTQQPGNVTKRLEYLVLFLDLVEKSLSWRFEENMRVQLLVL